MLSNQHFYHRIIRKMVVSFGTMFNNIRLVRYDNTGTVEIERITVPLAYANKEKFYKRIQVDPELTKEVQIILPRMGFNLDSVTYDPLRKTSLYNTQFSPNASGNLKSLQATPYNFDFTLSVYVRNVEDGTQIIEQILPYFNPDYTLSLNINGLPNNKVDVPIVLNSVNQNAQIEGSSENTRLLTWDLSFTVKGYLYGPLAANAKVIRKVTANTFMYSTSNTNTYKKLTLQSGSLNYKIGELVYVGEKLNSSVATGYVDYWDPVSHMLTLVDCNGVFIAGQIINGSVTGSSWILETIQDSNYQVNEVVITPNPLTANVDDDFGYTTTITDSLTNSLSISQSTATPDGGIPDSFNEFIIDGGMPASIF